MNPIPYKNLIWQALLAVIYIAVVLWILSRVDSTQVIWAIGAGSLSSSACIVFATPQAVASRPRNLIIGYLIGIIVGVIIHIFLIKLMSFMITHTFSDNSLWILASIAIGITMILMILTDTIHPPAVGMALMLVIDMEHYTIVAVILAVVLTLALIRHLLSPYLKSLVL